MSSSSSSGLRTPKGSKSSQGVTSPATSSVDSSPVSLYPSPGWLSKWFGGPRVQRRGSAPILTVEMPTSQSHAQPGAFMTSPTSSASATSGQAFSSPTEGPVLRHNNHGFRSLNERSTLESPSDNSPFGSPTENLTGSPTERDRAPTERDRDGELPYPLEAPSSRNFLDVEPSPTSPTSPGWKFLSNLGRFKTASTPNMRRQRPFQTTSSSPAVTPTYGNVGARVSRGNSVNRDKALPSAPSPPRVGPPPADSSLYAPGSPSTNRRSRQSSMSFFTDIPTIDTALSGLAEKPPGESEMPVAAPRASYDGSCESTSTAGRAEIVRIHDLALPADYNAVPGSLTEYNAGPLESSPTRRPGALLRGQSSDLVVSGTVLRSRTQSTFASTGTTARPAADQIAARPIPAHSTSARPILARSTSARPTAHSTSARPSTTRSASASVTGRPSTVGSTGRSSATTPRSTSARPSTGDDTLHRGRPTLPLSPVPTRHMGETSLDTSVKSGSETGLYTSVKTGGETGRDTSVKNGIVTDRPPSSPKTRVRSHSQPAKRRVKIFSLFGSDSPAQFS